MDKEAKSKLKLHDMSIMASIMAQSRSLNSMYDLG